MRSRVWLWRLSLLAIAFSGVVGIFLLQVAEQDDLSILQSELENFQLVFAVFRLAAIAALIASWPLLVRQAAKVGFVSGPSAQLLRSARWRCARLMVILEFVIGFNGPEVVVGLLQELAE